MDQIKSFDESCYSGPEEERVQKFEPDYAMMYLTAQTLPPTWNASLFAPRETRESSEDGADGEAALTRDETEEDSEATRFMIQFIKYRDEIGKPYDDDARIGGKPIDMYKLHKAVHESGGFNRCNQQNLWLEVCDTLGVKSADKGQDLRTIYAT